MNNLKLSSKMHIMVIVTAIVIAIGVAVGLICEFVSDGYFNYGAEYSNYKSVVVDYAYIDYSSKDDVKEICDNEFKSAGVSYYTSGYGETDQGGEFVFKFNSKTDAAKIEKAVEAIHNKLSGTQSNLSSAYYHEAQTLLGGGKALTYCAIALAAAAAFQFIYFAVRYRLTMACSALLANVHNLAIYVSLLAITRVPVGSAAFAFGALTVLLTMIGCGLLFGRIRRNLKKENFAKLDVNEQVDTCAVQSLCEISVSAISVAAAAVILFVLLAISALSAGVIVAPAVAALISAVSAIYGTAFFTPAVYSRFKRIGDKFKTNKKAVKK